MYPGVKSIGGYAFGQCEKLTKIDFKGTVAQWKAIEKDNKWASLSDNIVVYCTDGTLAKGEA